MQTNNIPKWELCSRVKKSLKAEQMEKQKYKKTLGTIKRTIFTDTGNVWYYVSFLQNGNEITAKLIDIHQKQKA